MDIRTTAEPTVPPGALQLAKQKAHQELALEAGLDGTFPADGPVDISVSKPSTSPLLWPRVRLRARSGCILVTEAVRPPTPSCRLPASAAARHPSKKTMLRPRRLTGSPLAERHLRASQEEAMSETDLRSTRIAACASMRRLQAKCMPHCLLLHSTGSAGPWITCDSVGLTSTWRSRCSRHRILIASTCVT